MSEFEFRAFRDADWSDMVRFYEQFYRPGYIFTRREFFDWNFVAPPGSKGTNGQNLVLAGGKIIGILGRYPWALQIQGKCVPGVAGINLFLDPEYRGHKLGHRLIRNLVAIEGFLLAPGFNLRTLSMYERIGKAYPYTMRRISRPLSAEPVLALMEVSPRYLELEPSQRRSAERSVRECAKSRDASGGLAFERVDRFDDRWDDAWETIRLDYGFTTWRSANHLNWRFIDYPFPLYECYLARDGSSIVGLVVLRLESSSAGNVVRLVDCVSVAKHRRSVLAFPIEWAKLKNAILIDFFVGGKTDEDALASLGYAQLEDENGGSLLPMDFNPIRCRDSMQMLVLFLDDDDPRSREIAAGEFFFVKGDGDQDRAN